MTATQDEANPADAIAMLRQRLDAALAREAALAEVLTTIAASPDDPQPVFEMIARHARALCGADQAGVTEFDGTLIHMRAAEGYAPIGYFPRPPDDDNLHGRLVLHGAAIHIRDFNDTTERSYAPISQLLGSRSLLAVPLRRDGRVIGGIVVRRNAPGGFDDTQVAMLESFAAQTVIAISSANALRQLRSRTADLQESLEYQTATSDVLKVISRSAFDLSPVLDTLLSVAAELCGADSGSIAILEGENFRVGTHYARSGREVGSPVGTVLPVTRGTIVGRTILDRRIVHIEDMQADPDVRHPVLLRAAGTMLGVPLLRGEQIVGVIRMARDDVKPFTPRQIELVSTFADQAVIAIENTRLLTEQQEALARQTAMAQVLATINAHPGDLTPVFEVILAKAHALCGADTGSLGLFDGSQFRKVARLGYGPEQDQYLEQPYPLDGPHLPLLRGETISTADARDLAWSEATSAVLERSELRAVLEVPLFKDGRLLGSISAWRREVRAFQAPEIALLKSFADQAVIAIENARLLTEQREALERQTATAEVLAVINANPGNLAPVFETILAKAHALCGADSGALGLFDGANFRKVARHGYSVEADDALSRPYPAMVEHAPLLRGETIHVPDVLAQSWERPEARQFMERSGLRTWLEVPLFKDGTLLGTVSGWRRAPRAFQANEIALLESFAAQAVIAMENARLLTEQQEALERQTATAEVLAVINANPGNLAPVFEAMLEKAMRLCGAAFGMLRSFDGENVSPLASRGLPPAFAEYLRVQGHFRPSGQMTVALQTGKPRQTPDLMTTEAYQSGTPASIRAIVDLGGAHTMLHVPLVKDQVSIGFFSFYRQEVRPFNDKQLALLESFAAQAVIAMENARLLTEQQEALDRQTATAEVLAVINANPGNLAPVFEAMLEKAMRLCGAAFGMLRSFDGENVSPLASRGLPPAFAEYLRVQGHFRPAGQMTVALQTGKPRQTPDLMTTEAYQSGNPPIVRAMVDLGGAHTILHVPLVKDQVSVGFFTFFRQEVRAFTERQMALLESFAAQAVIAMENARLLTEQQEALERQTATAEVLAVINANPGNLAPVFDTMLERAMRLCGVAFGLLHTWDGTMRRTVATRGLPAAFADHMADQPETSDLTPLIVRLFESRKTLEIPDSAVGAGYRAGHPYPRALVDLGGARTTLQVPLLKEGGVIGYFSLYRQEVRSFAATEIALLEYFAAQAVIAIENARLLNAVRLREDELRTTFENMGDGVAMFDAAQILVAWNRKFQDILDLPDGVLYHPPWLLTHEGDSPTRR